MEKKIISTFLTVLMVLGMFQAFTVNTQAAVKFKVSASQMKKDLRGYSVKIDIDGQEERFIVNQNEITKFTTRSKKYNVRQKSETLQATVYINRTVATVKAPVTLKYNLKGKKWKLSSVKFAKGTLSSVNLKGIWVGTYVAGQGQTKAQFNINEVSKDGYASGIFNFSATPTNPDVPSGSYSIKGGYDKNTGKVTLAGDEWIDQPSGYEIVDFYGYLDLKNKKIRTDEDNYSLSISRQ